MRARCSPHESWEDRRRREIDFDDGDPTVLVVGAGHCGLEVAARLTYLGVPTLVIDRNQRIGDNVRSMMMRLFRHAEVICGSGGHGTRRYVFMTRFVSRSVECMRHLNVMLGHRERPNAIPRVSRQHTRHPPDRLFISWFFSFPKTWPVYCPASKVLSIQLPVQSLIVRSWVTGLNLTQRPSTSMFGFPLR